MSAPSSSKIDLLSCSPHGGCSAKLSPKDLEALVGRLPAFAHPDLLVGVETHDDAAAFRISEDKALVFTTDFFPPVCSDAETFGRLSLPFEGMRFVVALLYSENRPAAEGAETTSFPDMARKLCGLPGTAIRALT